jgi:hypothetical protein
MLPNAGSRERAQDKLVCWKTEVGRDTFRVAEMDVMFDSTGIPLDGRTSPSTLNSLGNMVPRLW